MHRSLTLIKKLLLLGMLLLLIPLSTSQAASDIQQLAVPAPQQSTTGPTPSAAILFHDSQKPQESREGARSEVLINVPAYNWRHGCGPTAVGMVIGYYDLNGYFDLVPGSAWTQTDEVTQMIASGGSSSQPNPPGSEQHFEDYALPKDSASMITDAYITAGRSPHEDNCVADFMHTSKSTHFNRYGWSWSNHIGPAFVGYINHINPTYTPTYNSYYTDNGSLNWNVLTREIDAGRPMVFLVDSDGNGSTDHFATIVGYRDTPTQQYAALDTWYSSVRWENFSAINSVTAWGIWGGWSFELAETGDPYENDDESEQASLIHLNSSQEHSIIPANDTDWVKFRLPLTASIALETTGYNNDDTVMWLYDSDLNQLAFNDNSGTGSYALIERDCGVNDLSPGTYYVKVKANQNDEKITQYELSLDISFCPVEDPYEPDDDSQHASLISPNDIQTHSIYPEADEDWVQFTLTEESFVLLRISNMESGAMDMGLYDSDNNEIEFNTAAEGEDTAIIDRPCGIDALPPGTYYLKAAEHGDPPRAPETIPLYELDYYAYACPGNLFFLPVSIKLEP